jgi:hypothetical protein
VTPDAARFANDGMHARAKKSPLNKVTVSLRHQKIHAADCHDLRGDQAQFA